MGTNTSRLPRGLALLGTVALIGLAGCGGTEDADTAAVTETATATTASSPTTTATRTPSPTTTTPRLTDAILSCYNSDDGTTLTVRVTREMADFTSAWGAANGGRCEGDDIAPTTELEKQAYAVSGYDNNDVSTLYGICASVNPKAVVLQEGFAMNEGQAAEIQGALTLCPDHPLAAEYADAIEAAGVAQDEIASGARVSGGTHKVPEEMQRGTFVAKDVTDCYWETRDTNGRIIDNDFIVAAPQVRVTVPDGAVVFTTEGCGVWVKEG